jgi:hypothetical protein
MRVALIGGVAAGKGRGMNGKGIRKNCSTNSSAVHSPAFVFESLKSMSKPLMTVEEIVGRRPRVAPSSQPWA